MQWTLQYTLIKMNKKGNSFDIKCISNSFNLKCIMCKGHGYICTEEHLSCVHSSQNYQLEMLCQLANTGFFSVRFHPKWKWNYADGERFFKILNCSSWQKTYCFGDITLLSNLRYVLKLAVFRKTSFHLFMQRLFTNDWDISYIWHD